MTDTNSLSHSKWNCKYLIQVVVPILSLYLSKAIINILCSSNYENQKSDFIQFIFVIAIVL